MTPMQHRLANLLQEIAKEEGTDEQGALRDIMTDFRHIADMYSLDIDQAVEGSKAVYDEEIATGCTARTNAPEGQTGPSGRYRYFLKETSRWQSTRPNLVNISQRREADSARLLGPGEAVRRLDTSALEITLFSEASMLVTPADPVCEHCARPKSEHGYAPFVGTAACEWTISDGTRFRRRNADMPRLGVAPHPDVPLGSYVHTKSGGRYEVLGGTFLADGREDLVFVAYQSVADGFLAHRSVAGFRERFTPFVAPREDA